MSQAIKPGKLFCYLRGAILDLFPFHVQDLKSCLIDILYAISTQEITLLSQLSHPNIVQYHGSELVTSEPTKIGLYKLYISISH